MYSLILVALALCLASASSADKVVVGFYSEQLCPDCLMLSNGPLTDAFEQVSVCSYSSNLITHALLM